MARIVLGALCCTLIACGSHQGIDRRELMDPESQEMKQQAPEQYRVEFQTSAGDFVVEVRRTWAPQGADRFYNLVRHGFYNDQRFFRVVENFMVQFGIPGDPELAARWYHASIPDDPVQMQNLRGTLSFAQTSRPNSRSTQVFINYTHNRHLDSSFAPFGKVVEGMEAVDAIYSGYGEQPQGQFQQIMTRGNEFLDEKFPELDRIKKAYLLQ